MMARYPLEVADIFRQYSVSFHQTHGAALSIEQLRAMRAIEICRTATLGGHVDQCDACGHQVISYNSCRNRHCPKCQSLKKFEWLQARQAELLPVEYFHVVFTVPDTIASIALQNKKIVYDILFRATAETLRQIAANPEHLGAEIGFLAILHTWGQNLMHHPHIHCVVPGGGLSSDGISWISSREGFFLPVRVLSRLFRGIFLDLLKKAFDRQDLKFFGELEKLSEPAGFSSFLKSKRWEEWVVYAKRPFGGPTQVLNYLGRYTHRVAISNNRLVSLKNGKVTFTWKDYRHGDRISTMSLDSHEFIRRFLMHVLPEGFVRIRHFGFLSNCHRERKLAQCRQALNVTDESQIQESSPPKDWKSLYEALTGNSLSICPICKEGRMVCTETLQPAPSTDYNATHGVDSS
jgi:hypothetical protein